MKECLVLIILLIATGCASKDNIRVKELEDKIDKLTSLIDKNAVKENPTDEQKIEFETPTLNLKLPSVSEDKSSSVKNKIPLGVSNDIEFTLLFDSNSYWIVLKPLKDNVNIEGIVVMNITHEDKSPESLSFFQIQKGIFKSHGDSIRGKIELEIIFSREEQKSIIFNIEATI